MFDLTVYAPGYNMITSYRIKISMASLDAAWNSYKNDV